MMHPVLQNIFISFVSAGPERNCASDSVGAESTGACVETLARGAPVDQIARSHEDMVRELDELLRANDRTCEKSDNEIWADEEPPMFLRRTG